MDACTVNVYVWLLRPATTKGREVARKVEVLRVVPLASVHAAATTYPTIGLPLLATFVTLTTADALEAVAEITGAPGAVKGVA